MAGKAKVWVTGIKEIDAALKQLERKEARKVFAKATREAAKVVQKLAVAGAPVDTGLLARSLKVRSTKKLKNAVGAEVRTGDQEFGGETFYGSFQEYGTSKIPPQGFLRKAYDAGKKRAAQVMEAEAKKGLKHKLQ